METRLAPQDLNPHVGARYQVFDRGTQSTWPIVVVRCDTHGRVVALANRQYMDYDLLAYELEYTANGTIDLAYFGRFLHGCEYRLPDVGGTLVTACYDVTSELWTLTPAARALSLNFISYVVLPSGRIDRIEGLNGGSFSHTDMRAERCQLVYDAHLWWD